MESVLSTCKRSWGKIIMRLKHSISFVIFFFLIVWCVYTVYTYRMTIDCTQNKCASSHTPLRQYTGKTSPKYFQDFKNHIVEQMFSKWRLKGITGEVLALHAKGRLGNLMFEYASLLGIAAKNGKRPVFMRNEVLGRVFNVSFLGQVDTYLWQELLEMGYASYYSGFEKLPRGHVRIGQYLQSWKYFEAIERQLRQEFKLSKTYQKLGRDVFINATSGFHNRVVVAVHVRRGDMTSQTGKGYTAAPLSYVRNAMSYMKSKFNSPVFLVATDDQLWCRQHLRAPEVTIMHNRDPFVDFAALTMCNHTIMTVGTFGWWAAWLIDGHTVYYRNYPIPGREVSVGFNKDDFFLPHWVAMGDGELLYREIR